jgi:hypothetical protein
MPGRFGSSRKKEAAGAARWIVVAMGFECGFWIAARERGWSAGLRHWREPN